MTGKDKTPRDRLVTGGYEFKVLFGSSDISGYQHIAGEYVGNSKSREVGQIK